MLKLYNSLSKKKEEFKPIKLDGVGMYACGPTVYDFAHIGNMRTYLMEDILFRTLSFNGYKTKYVQNITDVGHLVGDGDEGEDKIEKGARIAGKSAREIADFYTKAYEEDLLKLNIKKPEIIIKATDHIKEQIEMIQQLEKLGFAYKTSDGIYFDTGKLKDYGKLTGLKKENILEGARVEKNPEKINETDFALWKFSPKDKKRQMEWESPWGIGFPGWHIECSAMSIKYLGELFDIHAGGVDHLPIHHTNEIAQNEAVYGHKTVNYWIHGAFLLVNGGRMGKSLGNAYPIGELEKRGFDPLAFRYFTFYAHYRQPLNFTWQALEGAQKSYNNLINKVSEIYTDNFKDSVPDTKYLERFSKTINDDLNMPVAIVVLWELLKDKNMSDNIKLKTVSKFDEIFGLSLLEKAKINKEKIQEIPKEIISLSEERNVARKNKDWAKADEIRLKILDMGYLVKDEEIGTKIIKR